MTGEDPAVVRRFYDSHTRWFLAVGQGRRTGAIRRAVWGPGVTDRDQAFHFVDHEIAELIRSLSLATATPVVADLGCGVGASLCYLAARLPIRGIGLTLSPVQARAARQRIERAGLADRVACVEADFCRPPDGIAPVDVAFAIEAFVHAPAAEPFFTACARLVRPGGLLAICDDLARPAAASPEAAAAIARYRRGWRVRTLLTEDELAACAACAGFVHRSTLDLTPYLELRRPRDRVIAPLAALVARLPGAPLGYLAGGDALQRCLLRGWIAYVLVVFRRAGADAPRADLSRSRPADRQRQ